MLKASATALLGLALRVKDIGKAPEAIGKPLHTEALAAIDTPADHAHRAAAEAWAAALPTFAEVGSALSVALAQAAVCYMQADRMPQGEAAAPVDCKC